MVIVYKENCESTGEALSNLGQLLCSLNRRAQGKCPYPCNGQESDFRHPFNPAGPIVDCGGCDVSPYPPDNRYSPDNQYPPDNCCCFPYDNQTNNFDFGQYDCVNCSALPPASDSNNFCRCPCCCPPANCCPPPICCFPPANCRPPENGCPARNCCCLQCCQPSCRSSCCYPDDCCKADCFSPECRKCPPPNECYQNQSDSCDCSGEYNAVALNKPNDYCTYPKRVKSVEIIGSKYLAGCFCTRRNGLQDCCRRWECKGSPECTTTPCPICRPSFYADGKTLGKKYGKCCCGSGGKYVGPCIMRCTDCPCGRCGCDPR